jgi:hypothetical protein
MLCPKTWNIKRTKSPGTESQPSSTKNLGSNRNPSIGGRIWSLRGHDQAQRFIRKLYMIPTIKSEPKHLRIEGTSRTWKSNKNISKITWKSHELQEGNRRNHEIFHSLGGQILYKTEEKSNPMEQGNEKQSEWMVCLEILELIYMSPSRARQMTTVPLALKLWYKPLRGN